MAKFLKIYRNEEVNEDDDVTIIELVRVEDIIKVFTDGGTDTDLYVVVNNTYKNNYQTFCERYKNGIERTLRVDEIEKILNGK